MSGIQYVGRRKDGIHYALAVPAEGMDPYHHSAADYGAWTHVQDCLLSLVSPGDTIIDIGANIGTVAIPLAARGVKVIAYEALPENIRFLEAAIQANGFGDRVAVRNVAVWDSAARLSLTGESAWGRVTADGNATHEAVTIDADLPAGTTVKAIKIDVEGSELHVLRGMRALLTSQHPHIVFESNSLELGRLGSSAAMMFDLLEQYGYRVYRIYASRRLLRPGPLPQEIGVADFLATRSGAWSLRRQGGFRVGTLRNRHRVKRILDRRDDEWADHLHLLAVAHCLPDRVTRRPDVAHRMAAWRAQYRGHPMLETVRQGVFGRPEDKTNSQVETARCR